MSHSLLSIYVHVVFSTRHREPLIRPEFEDRLKFYIKGIAENHGMEVLAINGTTDHMHILIDLPSRLSVSKAVKNIKGSSSKWLNDEYFEDRSFSWQAGYGAFSIHRSLIPTTIRYIQNQKEHHADVSYRNEFNELLNR